jgi:hypothetical protein
MKRPDPASVDQEMLSLYREGKQKGFLKKDPELATLFAEGVKKGYLPDLSGGSQYAPEEKPVPKIAPVAQSPAFLSPQASLTSTLPAQASPSAFNVGTVPTVGAMPNILPPLSTPRNPVTRARPMATVSAPKPSTRVDLPTMWAGGAPPPPQAPPSIGQRILGAVGNYARGVMSVVAPHGLVRTPGRPRATGLSYPELPVAGAVTAPVANAPRNFAQGVIAPGLERFQNAEGASPLTFAQALATDPLGNLKSGLGAVLNDSGAQKIGAQVPALRPDTPAGSVYNALTAAGSDPLNLLLAPTGFGVGNIARAVGKGRGVAAAVAESAANAGPSVAERAVAGVASLPGKIADEAHFVGVRARAKGTARETLRQAKQGRYPVFDEEGRITGYQADPTPEVPQGPRLLTGSAARTATQEAAPPPVPTRAAAVPATVPPGPMETRALPVPVQARRRAVTPRIPPPTSSEPIPMPGEVPEPVLPVPTIGHAVDQSTPIAPEPSVPTPVPAGKKPSPQSRQVVVTEDEMAILDGLAGEGTGRISEPLYNKLAAPFEANKTRGAYTLTDAEKAEVKAALADRGLNGEDGAVASLRTKFGMTAVPPSPKGAPPRRSSRMVNKPPTVAGGAPGTGFGPTGTPAAAPTKGTPGNIRISKPDKADRVIPMANLRNVLVRNLTHVQRESPTGAFPAALKAAGARGQAVAIVNQVLPKIAEEMGMGPKGIEAFFGTLTEGRLRGIRATYDEHARAARDHAGVSDDDFAERYDADGIRRYLNAFGDREDMNGVAKIADSLLAAGHTRLAREYIADVFATAAGKVGTVSMGPRLQFDRVSQEPGFQRALAVYKENVEKPITESHLLNQGHLATNLGPLDTYIPLVAQDAAGEAIGGSGYGVKKPYARPKNPHNNLATGLAERYDITAKGTTDTLARALRQNAKAALIDELDKAGLLVRLGKNEPVPTSMMMGGREVAVVPVETSDSVRVIKEGENAFTQGANRAVVPVQVYRELEPILNRDVHLPDDPADLAVWDALARVNQYALVGPLDAVYHTTNLLGTLIVKTPFVGPSIIGRTIGNTPVTKLLGELWTLSRMDVNAPEYMNDVAELARLGLVPTRYGSETYSRAEAAASGAKLSLLNELEIRGKKPFAKLPDKIGPVPASGSLGPALMGTSGVDMRARVLMLRIAKMMNPKVTDTEVFEYVSHLGLYNRDLEGIVERALKGSGIAPFYTAASTMYRNGLDATIGGPRLDGERVRWTAPGGKMPTGALPTAKRVKLRAMQMAAGTAAGVFAWWLLLHYLYRDEWPWEDPESRLFDIHIKPEHRWSAAGRHIWHDDREGYVSMDFFNPLVGRGVRETGVRALYNSLNSGDTGGEASERAYRDALNSLLHPITNSPSVRGGMVALTGTEPYIMTTRGRGSYGAQLKRAVPTVEPGVPQLGANLLYGAASVNPFIGDGLTAAASLTGFVPETESGGASETTILRNILDYAFPRLWKDGGRQGGGDGSALPGLPGLPGLPK